MQTPTARTALFCFALLVPASIAGVACTSDDDSAAKKKGAAGTANEKAGPKVLRTRTHTPGPPQWNAKGVCPPPPAAALPLPKTDRWSGLITIRDQSNYLYMAPLHASVTPDGDLLMIGFSRITGDFALETFDIAPTFVMSPDIHSEGDTQVKAEIYGAPFEKNDSWFCGGHTFLADGRPIVVGGTRTATNAVKPGLPEDKRGWGLNYGAIFGESGWVRIHRDFLAGEAWYPTLTRLSDGRLIMYSGYYELDANLPEIQATLDFNRAVQIYDPKDPVEPWTMISPSASTPEGTEPANYTWIYELPEPIDVGGRPRHLLMKGAEGRTYLVNHLDPSPNPATRFVERTRRSRTVDGSPEPSIVLLLPFFHEAEKLRYRPGSVLAIGGGVAENLEMTDSYDPYIDQWCSFTKPLGVERKNSAYTYLPDGNLLVINGEPEVPFDGTGRKQNIPQIIDPRTGQVADGKPEPLNSRRGYHNVAVLVPDGRVFVGAGRSALARGDPNLPDERTDAHFYSPYYLGILAPSDRPKVVNIPKDPVMHYNGDYVVDYTNGEITGAALVGLPSMTHATDFNGRYVELEVKSGGQEPRGKVTLGGPSKGTIAPPGHYMLFLHRKVRGVNVPSVAQIIRVDGPNPTCEGGPLNACGGCGRILNLPAAPCQDICGAGTFKCDGPNKTSCNACL